MGIRGAFDHMPKISVLIPAYNVERYIVRCLDSVIRQTLADIEIVIVNDRSTDGTAAIIDEYAARDSRIKVINHPENCGLLWTRKTCVEASSGDYLMFVDSDDALKLDACEKLYSQAVANDADLVIAGAEFCYSDGMRVPKRSTLNYGSDGFGVAKAMLKNESLKYVWGKLYQRRLLVESHVEYQKGLNLGEDLIISFTVARIVGKAICIPDVVYEYYENYTSLSRVYSEKLARDNIVVLLKTIDLTSAISGDLRELSEVRAVKRFHALIKKRKVKNRHFVVNTLKELDALSLVSFKSLTSLLGFRKGMAYYLVFHSDFASKLVERDS